jgi:response regulator RpfG family c-di-GMP phosphodiesterase
MPVDSTLMLAAERNNVLRSVLNQLDKFRPGERAHAERAAVYSVAIGQRLGMRNDDLVVLMEAATLHDIGKLAIESTLFAKPVFDDDDHFAAQLHTILFVKVMPGPDWLERCGPLIRGHHERWDGGGYPDGLAGSEIPFGARIIAVAEAFDTMHTGAGWREPQPEEKVLAHIAAGSGVLFDPEVVAAFLEVQPLIQPLLI